MDGPLTHLFAEIFKFLHVLFENISLEAHMCPLSYSVLKNADAYTCNMAGGFSTYNPHLSVISAHGIEWVKDFTMAVILATA